MRNLVTTLYAPIAGLCPSPHADRNLASRLRLRAVFALSVQGVMQQKCCVAAEAGGGPRSVRVGWKEWWWRVRREVVLGHLPRPARPCHQTNPPLFTPPSVGNVVFPVKTAAVTNPTRGARPLWQRVAVRGRRWQNLLLLGVFEGYEVGSSLDLPRPAPPCQHSVRHLLRHQKKRTLTAMTGE